MRKFPLPVGRHEHGLHSLRILLPALAVLFLVGAAMLRFSGIIAAPVTAAPSVTFPGTVSPLVAQSHLIGAADPNRRISLTIGLRPSNTQALISYAQAVSDPKSAAYHHYASSAQITGAFGPTLAEQNAVLQFLRSSGFTITQTYSHRLLIGFSGTLGQVEQAFRIAINNYAAPNGRVYYANASEPTLPASIASMVQSISGLNDALELTHSQQTMNAVQQADLAQHNTVSCPVSLPNSDDFRPYHTPPQIAQIYGFVNMYTAQSNLASGRGQTVALFELDSFQVKDLNYYEACFGQSHAAIQTIATGQNPVPSDKGVLEDELDAELVLSTAPGLGILKIYEAANDTADYNAEWARIIQDAPPIVSTSWGACEKNIGLQEAQQENIFFAEATAQGQTIFAASGDSGSAGCYFETPSSTGLNVVDPASQPFVTGVGGTSLEIYVNVANETYWNAAQGSPGATGGGISQFWTMPTWQQGYRQSIYESGKPCNAPSGSYCREVPDVAFSADPRYGYPIYCSSVAASCASSGKWYVVGGTSAAAPMWAGWMAMANEMSLSEGGMNLGFLNPLLYQAFDAEGYLTTSKPRITIIAPQVVNNDWLSLNNGLYQCNPNNNTYNFSLCTGMGSPSGTTAGVILQEAKAIVARTSPTNTTWYFAEGSVGGSFTEYLTMQNPDPSQAATVNVTYLFESQPSRVVTHTVAASTRVTVNVNDDLHIPSTAPQQAISAIVQVTSGPGIVVERPMYFDFKGIRSGTDVIGATKLATSFYFPFAYMGHVSGNFYTYITMLNPSATQTASATVTFYDGVCGQTGQPACATQTITVPPLHRGTVIPPWNQRMSVAVTTSIPMVVERPSYYSTDVPTSGVGNITGAASVIGATTPGNDWLFAEGYTGYGFQEYLVLANYTTTSTTATVTLEYSDGSTQTRQVSVPALGTQLFDVNYANTYPTGTCNPTPCTPTSNVSAEVTSTGPIVVERQMFFNYGPSHYPGSTEAIGEQGPASHSVYAFAEGYTANTFAEYLTLQNPTNSDETVAVTLLADTYVWQQQVLVPAHSRQTITINDLVTPIAQAYNNMGANSYAVSLSVQALGANAKIVAERPMYFDYYGDPGGTDVIGYTGG
jgi:kumamolisin